jgi:CheY-like chemotaxis protein
MANVLIVDDNDLVVQTSARAVASKGHEVHTADTGEEGLRALKASPLPDCVILDVEMPVLTGPEMAYEMFRNDHGMENVPIVLVSGRDDLSEIAARVGTPYYLSKATSHYMQVLLATLARALQERKAPSAPAGA